jgi:hypothetical protein
VGKPEGWNYFEELGVDGGDNIKWILNKQGRIVWTGFTWFMIGTNGGLL